MLPGESRAAVVNRVHVKRLDGAPPPKLLVSFESRSLDLPDHLSGGPNAGWRTDRMARTGHSVRTRQQEVERGGPPRSVVEGKERLPLHLI